MTGTSSTLTAADVHLHPALRLPPALVEGCRALADREDARVLVIAGHDLAWESEAVHAATRDGRALLTVRIWSEEAEVGPLWSPATAAGCPVCQVTAQFRTRGKEQAPAALRASGGTAEAAHGLLREALALAAQEPLPEAGTLTVCATGSSRHRLLRQSGCPACAPAGTTEAAGEPRLGDLDAELRHVDGPDLSLEHLHRQLVDLRYGPVLALRPMPDVPAALVGAMHSREERAKETAGYGRGRTLGRASRLALLERLERAGSQHVARTARPLVAAYRDIAGQAVDPRRLGMLSAEQLAHPNCRVDPFTEDQPMSWTPARVWGTGQERYVPLESASYHLHPRPVPGQRWGRVAYESSNGCALGASPDEAAVHALLEVVERDAFLHTWWSGRPVPRIDWRSVTDPTTRELRALIRRAGYEIHLCAVTQDIALPVVWALAINTSSRDKYSLTAAAAHPDPVSAVRAAVTELAPIVLGDLTAPDRQRALALREDPWQVTDLDDHVRWYSVPEAAPAFEPFLSGPLGTLDEAFPAAHRLPRRRRPLAEVREDLTARLAAAGLGEVLVLDQTGPEHRAAGLHAARVLVPGAIPLTFGYAHQRVFGLPRLARFAGPQDGALADRLTVHPFP
ncbi:YcaO-like family protein [Streptomyces sp. NPDC049555]|uniref:YcaO-like family protein n=1 Tax=Streptomyces sp. NPDC049555 TaxID=3154930 RepID=UPI00342D27E6